MNVPIVSLNSDNSFVYHLTNIPEFNSIIHENDFQNINAKVNKISYKSPTKQDYHIIRYNKNLLSSDEIYTIGLLRSVILNSSGNVVAFSPPKSISWINFLNLYPEKSSAIVAEEFIEGTMMNVFWDSNIGISGAWEIATRSCVGAEISFYQEPSPEKPSMTFRSMFMEAVKEVGLDLNKLNKNYCYSFVLQHPLNRIVVPFKKPNLYLVSVYEIVHTEGGIINVSCIDMNIVKKQNELWSETSVSFPKIYEDWDSYDNLIEKYANMNTNYEIVGVILKNLNNGARSKIRNPTYENVRHLRGNQPKLMYQYLSLRQDGKVKDYLKYYPEYKKDFAFFRTQLHKYTTGLYHSYIDCYIKKQKPLKEFSEKYRTHMYNIHQIYLTSLKEAGRHVSNTVVIEYVNKVHPTLQMYVLNYEMRKRHVDILKVDSESDTKTQSII